MVKDGVSSQHSALLVSARTRVSGYTVLGERGSRVERWKSPGDEICEDCLEGGLAHFV